MADESTLAAHENDLGGAAAHAAKRDAAARAEPQTPSRLETGCVIANRFVIQKFLGHGGMGDVYEAEDLQLNHARIALKTIQSEYVWSPTMRERFRHEVLLARSISHPNVCPVYEMFSAVGPDGEFWFLTMKLLSGETLATRLRRLGPLTAADTVRFAREIASALDCAHQAGVIHRDLKPSNIFLESYISGVRAVVTDFGLARNWGEEPWSADAGGVVGTPAYIAPEILSGETATPGSDVYAFGVVLHQMLWGSRPGDDDERPRDSAEQRMHRVVVRCICADPDLRYRSAGVAAEGLERAWNHGRRVFSRRELVLEGAALAAAVLAADEFGLRGGWDIQKLLSPVPRPRRVAVLAAHTGSLPIQEASLVSGIVESLSNNLARAEATERDLFVVPPRMVEEENIDDPSKVAGLFGANLVLQTRLEQSERQVKVDLSLTDCKTRRVIRHGVVTCENTSLQELPALATERAALLLDLREPKNLAAQVSRGGTDNPDAFLAFERGRESLRKASPSDVEQAIDALQRAVELDARFALAYATLAEAYVVKFRNVQEPAALDLAEENVRRCRALAPDLAQGFVCQAFTEIERGKYDAAQVHLKKAIALDPEDTLPRLTSAETYDKAGEASQAAVAYEALLAQHPNLWPALTGWANVVADTGDLKKAEQLLRRATVAGPEAYLPWRDLGAIYIELGEDAKAESALNRSIRLFPSGGAYYNLGIIFTRHSRFNEAVQAYQQAVNLNPNRAFMWDGLGDAYAMSGKQTAAAAAWKKAASLALEAVNTNPNWRDGVTRLALYQAKSKDRRQAAETLKRAQNLHPPNLEQLFIEARTNELIGRRDEALQQIGECVRRGYSKAEIVHAIELTALRKDPRFKRLGINQTVR